MHGKIALYLLVLHDGKMIGNFEKDELMERYVRYWFHDGLPEAQIPGEIKREKFSIISGQLDETEAYLAEQHIEWQNRSSLDMDDILHLLLTDRK